MPSVSRIAVDFTKKTRYVPESGQDMPRYFTKNAMRHSIIVSFFVVALSIESRPVVKEADLFTHHIPLKTGY